MLVYLTVLVLSVVVTNAGIPYSTSVKCGCNTKLSIDSQYIHVHVFIYTMPYTMLIEEILFSEIFIYFHYSMVMNTCLRLSPSGVPSVHGLPTYGLL